MRFVLPAFCATVLLPLVAYGQIEISGYVRDANSVPLAGARVTVQADAAAPAQTFTDPGGHFQFQLPAPARYRILAEKEGFYPAKAADLTGTDEITLVLEAVREVTESVDVTEPPTSLDLDSTTAKRTLGNQEIVNVPYPNSNDLKNAARTIPGVTRDNRGGLHINGAAEDQVLYTLNGFNINDPLTNRFDSRMNVESVQSVEVSSGNLTAEYGKGSGGTFAIRSQSGTDRLRYSATNFVPGFENRKGWIVGDWTPRFGISGPIRRGKAWFSNSSDIQYLQTVVRDLPKGEDRYSSMRFSNLLSGQVNLSPSHILHASFLVNGWNSPRSGLTAIDPRETTIDRRSRQFFFNVRDQLYLRRGALIEFGLGANRTYGREIPQGHEPLAYTAFGKRGNYYVDGTRRAARDQFLVNAFLPTFKFAGTHQLKSGIDLNHLTYYQDVRRTGYENYSETGARTRSTAFTGSGLARKSNEESAMYLQDSWRPGPHVLIELGLRGDWDRLVNRWSPSPRLGVSWSPARLPNTKFYGGFAQVYDATNLRLFSRPDDQYIVTSYFRPDGALSRGPTLSYFTIDSRPLLRPHARNYTLGAAHALPSGLTFRADFIRRRGTRGFTYRSLLDSPLAPAPAWAAPMNVAALDYIYNLGNERRDAFDSVSLSVRHVIHRQYEWMASYTRSRALSNAVVDISMDDPTIVTDNAGPMPWDSPNRFTGWAYLPLPRKDWAIAAFLDSRTGFPYSTQNEEGRIVGQVNAHRYPYFFEMNLHLEKKFNFRGHRWAWRFGANNITNRVNPDSVNPFLTASRPVRFYGGTGRAFNVRIRWLGRAN